MSLFIFTKHAKTHPSTVPRKSFGSDPVVIATVHPSSVLRAQGEDARHEAMAAFVADLRAVARVIERARKTA